MAEDMSPLTVTTTVTGLYAGPSFLTEMVSQLLNGTPVTPLKTAEGNDRWVFVRPPDGYQGWAYRPYLAAVPPVIPTHVVVEPISPLYTTPVALATLSETGRSGHRLATRIPGGLPVQAEVTGEWAHVTLAGGLAGYLPAAHLRAVVAMPTTGADRRAQLVADAFRYIGVPYLWGGCTAFGIDCSGLVQMLHRLIGITLPRDADMQFDAGAPVEPPYQPGDLLFFGDDEGPRKITHVALSLGGWRIIHASRSRNGVYEDDVQAVPHLRETFAGGRTFVG